MNMDGCVDGLYRQKDEWMDGGVEEFDGSI